MGENAIVQFLDYQIPVTTSLLREPLPFKLKTNTTPDSEARKMLANSSSLAGITCEILELMIHMPKQLACQTLSPLSHL